MEKRIKLIPVIVVLILLCTWRPSSYGIAAAVVPVDPGQELYQSIRHAKKAASREQKLISCSEKNEPLMIEVHKKHKAKKVFGAAKFVCSLPIESGKIVTTCSEPEEAEAALKKMKEQGFDEVWLKSPATGEVYDALVRSARELEMRINA